MINLNASLNFISESANEGSVVGVPELADFLLHIPSCGSSPIPYQKSANKQEETGHGVCGVAHIEIFRNSTSPKRPTPVLFKSGARYSNQSQSRRRETTTS